MSTVDIKARLETAVSQQPTTVGNMGSTQPQRTMTDLGTLCVVTEKSNALGLKPKHINDLAGFASHGLIPEVYSQQMLNGMTDFSAFKDVSRVIVFWNLSPSRGDYAKTVENGVNQLLAQIWPNSNEREEIKLSVILIQACATPTPKNFVLQGKLSDSFTKKLVRINTEKHHDQLACNQNFVFWDLGHNNKTLTAVFGLMKSNKPRVGTLMDGGIAVTVQQQPSVYLPSNSYQPMSGSANPKSNPKHNALAQPSTSPTVASNGTASATSVASVARSKLSAQSHLDPNVKVVADSNVVFVFAKKDSPFKREHVANLLNFNDAGVSVYTKEELAQNSSSCVNANTMVLFWGLHPYDGGSVKDVSNKDVSNEIQKLKKLCPNVNDIHIIFMKKTNTNAPITYVLGDTASEPSFKQVKGLYSSKSNDCDLLTFNSEFELRAALTRNQDTLDSVLSMIPKNKPKSAASIQFKA